MRYCQESDVMEMSVKEIVFFAREERAVSYSPTERGMGLSVSEADRLRFVGEDILQDFYMEIEAEGLRISLVGMADGVEDNHLTFLFRVVGDPSHVEAETQKQAMGEAYCVGHIYAAVTGRTPQLRIIYYSWEHPLPHVVTETPDKGKLEKFFQRVTTSCVHHALPEIDRIKRRLPTMRHAEFPFAHIREGQRELMEMVYSTIKHGRKLYAAAPTGIGKTMSTLYPAVRAMGEGHCEKVFYFTPKNTTAQAACDGVALLWEKGLFLRTIRLFSKEKLCPYGMCCQEGRRCPLSNRTPGREDEAARFLLAKEHPVVGEEVIAETARHFRICPHELGLRYSMYCDILICDYNYLFDFKVSLRRYFDNGGNYAFLIDEAHNLVERAREMYAVRYTERWFSALKEAVGEVASLQPPLEHFERWIRETVAHAVSDETHTDSDGVERGFYASSDIPDGMYTNVCNLAYAVSGIPRGVLPPAQERVVRGIGYDLLSDLEKLALYGEGFQTFYEKEGDAYTLRTVCLDPSYMIASRLEKGRSAVFFSATLTPVTYYRDVLGGDRRSGVLEVASPFERDHLCVAVMDKISTRYLNREETVKAVVRAILTAVKEKPGNYMVFCPSYAYMTAVSNTLRSMVPQLAVLVQEKNMDEASRSAFLDAFAANPSHALVGFCVMGGIYSEGIDLVGKRLIGAVVVGVGLPNLSDEREAIRCYYDEKNEHGREYAYTYPGMNRVLQAAGRVIRTEEDRGVVLLIDDRFATQEYIPLMPPHWRGLHYVGDLPSLSRLLHRFWHE